MRPVVAADRLILIEPIVNGRQYLAQMGQRKRLRSMLTQEQGQDAEGESQHERARGAADGSKEAATEDLDGWPLSVVLRGQIAALDLHTVPPPAGAEVQLLQVGPREQIAVPLARLGDRLGAAPRAVVLQPFWHQLDHVRPQPLLEALGLTPASERSAASPAESSTASTGPSLFAANQIERKLPSPRGEGQGERSGRATPPASPSPVSPDPVAPEHPLTFHNPVGQQSIGVWHTPAPVAGAPRPAIVMLHGWSGYRTGPHQMLTRAARRFAGAGFGVLRFDFAGRGDSQGDFEHATLATMADDARAALGWCRDQGHTRTVLVGLCSGCEVALALATEPGVGGMALWSAPVFAALAAPARTTRKRGHHLRQYARKLLRPASYAKLLGGRLDTRSIGQVLAHGGGAETKNLESDALGQLPPGWRQSVLDRYTRYRAPLLLVYGTADPLGAEALQWHRVHCHGEPRVERIAGANHSYYGLTWESAVIESTLDWLNRQCKL